MTTLIQASDGNLYGTTKSGGKYGDCDNVRCGTIFKITLSGKLTTLYSFCTKVNCGDGAFPYSGLIQAPDGNFYGTTYGGGATRNATYCPLGCGTVFQFTPGGRLTTLHSFCSPGCSDGILPQGRVMLATNGNFYGTTGYGGSTDNGTLFKITPGGKFAALFEFCFPSCSDGALPRGDLVQATDGDIYGTTSSGGPEGGGTVFKYTAAGTLTTLYSFCPQGNHCVDGVLPEAGMVQGTDGKFYGTLSSGFEDAGGIFNLDVGLDPFVSFIRNYGKVGQTVQILGQGFTGTTSVSFNGMAAFFTAVSDTYLKATVPAGATTGSVTVTTPAGTLASNQIFRVTPQILSFSPMSGPATTSVVITGESFTGATEVVFACGKAASFTVDSDTQITATVPTGAMTGAINVVTPGGHVGSTASFTVTP